jgi:hypothetical protein
MVSSVTPPPSAVTLCWSTLPVYERVSVTVNAPSSMVTAWLLLSYVMTSLSGRPGYEALREPFDALPRVGVSVSLYQWFDALGLQLRLRGETPVAAQPDTAAPAVWS